MNPLAPNPPFIKQTPSAILAFIKIRIIKYRNTKQARISNGQNSKFLNIRIYHFDIVSDFGFRISDFCDQTIE